MGYLKNKTFGFYLSFVAAILALIGLVMYRQSGLVNSFYTQVDFIGYVVSGLYEFATIKKFIISAVLMALSMIAYIVSSYSGFQKCTCKDETKA